MSFNYNGTRTIRCRICYNAMRREYQRKRSKRRIDAEKGS